MPKIVQFTHPGREHSPDVKGGNHKSWNRGAHRRKFLLSNGNYIENDILREGRLMCWGEWEPPSYVEEFAEMPTVYHPKWFHKPYLPEVIPVSSGYQESYQNIDPCIFGNCFKYFVCKQFKPKNRSLTSLARLEKGSMILFGSTGNQNTKNAFFQLDTVFIVSDYFEYDTSDENALCECSFGRYRDFVFKMAFPQPLDYSLKLRLYFGASFDNTIDGMYSLVPSVVYKNAARCGFSRVPLSDMKYISNNLNAAPKYSDVTNGEIINFWNELRQVIKNHGCVEGVRFSYDDFK